MKVGLVVDELNIRGGTHKQVQRLAEHLRQAGDDVRVLTKYYDAERCYAGVDALDVYAASRLKDAPQGKLARRIANTLASVKLAIATRSDDVVHIHDNRLKLFWLLAKIVNPRRKIAWQINDLPPSFRVGAAKGLRTGAVRNLQDLFDRLASTFMARHVDLVTVNVSKNARRVAECLGVPATVYHCGVDLRNDKLPPQREPSEVLNLVSTGVFFEYRNYESILRAQKTLTERYGVRSALTIIGSTRGNPTYAETVARLASSLDVPCRILGEVDDEALVRTYADSDIFLFVNVDQSWGLAVFEAMNCGLPVVVSKSVGAVELLRPEIDCDVVDPLDVDAVAETLHRLHANKQLRRQRSVAAFDATQRMTWGRLYCEPIRQELRRLADRNRALTACSRAPRGTV